MDQRKLDKVDAKLKTKLEKKALKDEEMASATKKYKFCVCGGGGGGGGGIA